MINDENYVFGNQNVLVPSHLNFGKFILNQLLKYKDSVALINAKSGEKMSYKEVTQFSVDLAYALSEIGVKKGEIVAFASEKRNEYIPTLLAIIFTGATYTPVEFHNGRGRLQQQLEITKPKYFICTELFWENFKDTINSLEFIKFVLTLDEVPKNVFSIKKNVLKTVDVNLFEPAEVYGQQDVAFIQYSSGTTGQSKAIMLTHLNCIMYSLGDDFSDKSLQAAWIEAEWYHTYDVFFTFAVLALGRTLVYHPNYETENILKDIQDYAINTLLLVPSIITDIITCETRENYNMDSLKIIYSSSGILQSETIMKVKEKLPSSTKVIQSYGMTEIGEITSEIWGDKGFKSGSVGMVSPGITIKIADITGKALGPNKQGEFCVRGPAFMKGYFGVESSNYFDEQGFFKTGDLGYYDDDRYFFFVGRLKDIINYNGFKVSPKDLENLLLCHPAVQDAGVVGKPDPQMEELPMAFIVRKPGSAITEQELINYVNREVSHYMQLKGGVKFIDEIPRNQRKKILRKRLQELIN